MKATTTKQIIVLTISILLITSVVSIVSQEGSTDLTSMENPYTKESFVTAATYAPGDYPSGLTLSNGDVLDGSAGGVFNINGNFTIPSGATVTVAAGYKITLYADNIIIAGILDGNGAGYSGGAAGGIPGGDGNCNPYTGRGRGGPSMGDGGGGGRWLR